MPITYRENDLPLIGATTAQHIAKEIEKFSSYYKGDDESELIAIAKQFFENQHTIDVGTNFEKKFDLVEKLLTDVKVEDQNFKHPDNVVSDVDKVTLAVFEKRYSAEHTFGSGGKFECSYKPLCQAWKTYTALAELKKVDVKALNGDYKDPWDEIENVDFKYIHYTDQEKNEKVQHVLTGLQSEDPGSVRDVYVNEDLKISDKLRKLTYQGNNYSAWKQEIDKSKESYCNQLWQKSLLETCESHIKRLQALTY